MIEFLGLAEAEYCDEDKATIFPNDSSAAEEEKRQRRLFEVGIASFLSSSSFLSRSLSREQTITVVSSCRFSAGIGWVSLSGRC